jgi:hypothetical protein
VRRVPAAISALALAAAGCASDGEDGSGIEIERADGSAIEFDGPLRAWCADGLVWILNGEAPADEDGDPSPFWFVSVPVRKARAGAPVEVGPHTDTETGGMLAYDARDDNLLSSTETESSGTIEFGAASCERDRSISVTVDVQLDSELRGPTATARGNVEVAIGEPVELPGD